MIVKYRNLTIRNATEKDASQLAVWWNDGKVMAHAGFPNGLNECEESIVQKIKQDTDETRRRLIIELDELRIGEMSFRNVGDLTAEIGIKICDFTKQNQGYGKILLSMLISFLFNDFGYKKIILDTNLKNKRAQHVYEQLGFTKIGLRENSWTDQIGELQSSIDYELTKEDFVNYAK